MPRQRKYNTIGRPSVDPYTQKMSVPARALLTPQVADVIVSLAKEMGIPSPTHGMIASDIVRLALYRLMRSKDVITADLDSDPTWNSLKEKGLV